MKFLAVLTALVFPASALAAPATEQADWRERVIGTTSTWVNSYGSVMTLDIAADGVVRGYIVNNAPGSGCRGIPYDLRGRATGGHISFRVSWRNGVADCQSETEWRGTIGLTSGGRLEIASHCHHRLGLAGAEVRIGVDRFFEQQPIGLLSLLDH